MNRWAAFALVLLVSVVYGAQIMEWRWDNEWINAENWNGGVLPGAGSIVTFPKSISEFGADTCISTNIKCVKGAVISIAAASPSETAQVTLKKMFLPSSGKLALRGKTMMRLRDGAANPAEFVDRGAAGRDFKCANNWVVQGTKTNPSFSIPCSQDKAVFPDGKAYMVSVPQRTFLASISLPAGAPITSDKHQFSGAAIGFQAGSCPQPFGSEKDLKYCSAWCTNSCPELQTNKAVADLATVAALQKTLSYLTPALNTTNSILNIQTASVLVEGAVLFPIPTGTSTSIVQAITEKIRTQLTQAAAFSIVFSGCTSGSGSAIACSASATIANSKKSLLTSKLSAPFTFIPGVILTIFGDMVSAWFQEAVLQDQVLMLSNTLRSSYFAVDLHVTQRFVTAMNGAVTSPAVNAYLSRQLAGATIFGVKLMRSALSGMAIIEFSVSSSSGISFATATGILTSTSQVLQFPTFSGSTVPLYVQSDINAPSVITVNYLQAAIQNSALAAALPLASDVLFQLDSAVGSFIDDKTSLGAEFLDTAVFTTSTVARRRATSDTVYLVLAVAPQSQLVNRLTEAGFFDGFMWGNVSSTTIAVQRTTAKDTQTGMLKTQLTATQALSNNATASVNAYLTSLADFGAIPSYLATGAYSWSDLNIVDDGSGSLPLTNEVCNAFTASGTSQQDVRNALAKELAKVLPITATGVMFGSNVTCGPRYAIQTANDQLAVFSVLGLKVTAYYVHFPNNRSYVTYASGNNDHSVQLSESSSALGMSNVRSALQGALRRVVLSTYTTVLNEDIAAITGASTAPGTPAASASDSGSASFVPIAAAAGGGVLLIVVVVVIVVTRRKRANPSNPNAPGARTVVAFENPMYAAPNKDNTANGGQETYDNSRSPAADYNEDANASAGLYDEPAFNATSEKDNPLYESTENLGFEDQPHLEGGGDNGYLDVAN